MSQYLDRYFKVIGRKKAGIDELEKHLLDETQICKNCVFYSETKNMGVCSNRKFRQQVQPVVALQNDLFEDKIRLSLELQIRVNPNFGCKYFK